jgi:hypothetical protein
MAGPGSAPVMAAWLPLLLCCATASADALPPNVPIHDRWSPLWHQPDHSRLSAGDVNAFFFFNGVCESACQAQCVVSRVSLTQRIICRAPDDTVGDGGAKHIRSNAIHAANRRLGTLCLNRCADRQPPTAHPDLSRNAAAGRWFLAE